MVALHKARYFVLGCQKLTVAMDHKPLLKVFGDRQLCELENPRLTILKEKAMYFRLDMVHVHGRFHKGPDAMSRVPNDMMNNVMQGEVASILDGASTKDLRIGILRQLWSPLTGEGMCDIPDHQAKAVMEDEFSYLGAAEQKDGEVGYQVAVLAEKGV